jgi:DNA-binding transcriptional ArsR family regulator
MAEWSFLTNHARVLICIAHDPGVRLRDIAAKLGITERSAYSIVTELTDAGYVVKQKDGRRNRYEIQGDLPLRGSVGRERTIGEVLNVLVEASALGDPDAATQRSDRSHDAPGRVAPDSLISVVAKQLKKGDEAAITGFGKITVTKRRRADRAQPAPARA